jgi:hypothetical protein
VSSRTNVLHSSELCRSGVVAQFPDPANPTLEADALAAADHSDRRHIERSFHVASG